MASKITIKEISIFKVHNRPTKDLTLHVPIEHENILEHLSMFYLY
jgi:hypothetical protein